jgi:hypothetical protein
MEIDGVRKNSACRADQAGVQAFTMRNSSALRQVLHRWLCNMAQILNPTRQTFRA